METQRQRQIDDDYAAQRQLQTKQDDAVRELERTMTLSEFEEDRDVILMMIKDALKTRSYGEAQEIVHKYRAAAKTDEEFATLARMTAQGLEGDKKVASIKTVLDATPEDDYDTRIALYERILKIQPGHEEYTEKLNECKRLRGDAVPDAQAPAGASSKVPATVANAAATTVSAFFSLIKTIIIATIVLVVLILIFGMLV